MKCNLQPVKARPGLQMKNPPEPNIIQSLFQIRFNELMAESDFSATQFAQEKLDAKGLSPADCEKVVQEAVWRVLNNLEKPRLEELKDLETFRKYFFGLINAVVESKTPTGPVEMIKANARLVIRELRPLSDVGFGFNPQSVPWLEDYIERLRQSGGLGDDAQKSKLVNMFGSFVGECIIECYGGKWIEREGAWGVAFDNQNIVYPFGKVAKQIENGLEDGIGGFFQTIPALFRLPARPLPENVFETVSPLLKFAPLVKSAHVKRKFQAGNRMVVLFDDIVAEGSVKYRFIMAVLDENLRPCFLVTSEVNPLAKRFGGGSHYLGIFDGDSHGNRGSSDDWADEARFMTEALRIIQDKFEDFLIMP
jgi:hypothetical protein